MISDKLVAWYFQMIFQTKTIQQMVEIAREQSNCTPKTELDIEPEKIPNTVKTEGTKGEQNPEKDKEKPEL